jgi:hypothetical protein
MDADGRLELATPWRTRVTCEANTQWARVRVVSCAPLR